MNRAHQSLYSKIFLIGCTWIFAQFLIIIRLGYLQITLEEVLLAKSRHNFLRYETIASLRGNILDCSGKLIATNRPVVNIYWKGSGARSLTATHNELLKQLETITQAPLLEPTETITAAERKAQTILLVKDVNFELLSKIAELFSTHSSIVIKTDFIRFYPYDSLASHVLGYLGTHEHTWIGKTGLEKACEDLLQGKAGINQKILNSFGKHLEEKEIEEGLPGQDITLTLNLELQQIAESLFPEGKRGAFVLMNPQDGSILVALSRPDFNPNVFLEKMDLDAWRDMKEKKPFMNRIFNSTYPPGSIFKLITLSTALELGYIDQSTQTHCAGSVIAGERKFRCNNKDGHGTLSVARSIAKSCNVLFYKLAKKMDIDDLARYANSFGLGRITDSGFNESPGLIPTRKWKRAKTGERWYQGDTLSANIGQSYLLVTPIQIARMVGSIETGHLVTPRIVQSAPVKCEPLTIAPSTRNFLQETMMAVVQEGTAHVLNSLTDFTIRAKTSTAQTSALEKRDMGEEYLEHGWAAINFRYKNNPPLTLVIIVENAGGTRMPLMVAKTFMKSYKKVLDLEQKKRALNEPVNFSKPEITNSSVINLPLP